jgi:hypothetical protein
MEASAIVPYEIGLRVKANITGAKGKIEKVDLITLTYSVLYGGGIGLKHNQPHHTIQPLQSTKKTRLASYNGFYGKIWPYLQYKGNEAIFGQRNSLSWDKHDCINELAWLVGWFTQRGYVIVWTTEQHKPRVVADASSRNMSLDGVMFVGEKSDSTAYHCKFLNPAFEHLDVILGELFDTWGGGGSGLEINSRNLYHILCDIGHPLREGVTPTQQDLNDMRVRVAAIIIAQAEKATEPKQFIAEVLRHYDHGVSGLLPY